MNALRCWAILPAFCLLTLPLLAGVQPNELRLSDSAGTLGGLANVELTLTNPESNVEGLVAVFDWDGAGGTGEHLVPGAAIAAANVVSMNIGADFMAIGVVMDDDGVGGEIIPPGTDQEIATAEIRCGALGTTAVNFADGKYALSGTEPLVDNIIVVGGLSIGANEGLVLTSGSFDCQPGVVEMKIGTGTGTLGGVAEVPVTLNSPDFETEGFVVSCEWDGNNGTGVGVVRGAAVDLANVFEARVAADHAVIGVVMDNDGQGGEVIPAGTDLDLATLEIRCMGNEGTFDIAFVDGKYALAGEEPLLDNIVVQGGRSIGATEGLILTDGSFSCEGGDLRLVLGAGTGFSGSIVGVPLTADAPNSELQGLVAVFEWVGGGTADSLVPGAGIAGADTVSIRADAGASFMALGVVMDNDGEGGEVIQPGTGIDIATANILCGDGEGTFDVVFVDDTYALMGEEPKLDNIVVEGGLSIGVEEGLELVNGSFTCEAIIGGVRELRAGSAPTVDLGQVGSLPLIVNAPNDDVQGLVMVVEWDAAGGGVEDLVPGAALADADTVSIRADGGANFALLGVVMDADGEGGEVISSPENLEVATLSIRCADAEGTFSVDFVDGTHSMTDGGPVLDNILVINGTSIGVEDGLILTSGSFSCAGVGQQFAFVIQDGGSDSNAAAPCGTARVLMTNTADVEAYVTAVCHDSAVVTLQSIEAGFAATDNGADFIQPEILDNGGTLGVVLDLEAPFDGNVIPPGNDQEVALYTYCCNNPPAFGDDPVSTPLTLCDNVLGQPVKENVVVVLGQSIGANDSPSLQLTDGAFICNPLPPVQDEICDNGIDDNGNGLVDCDDPDCFEDPACPDDVLQRFACGACEVDENGDPLPLQASIGTTFPVCFYIQSPEDNEPGHAQFDHIQGFTMSVSFCCDLFTDGELDITGTILEAVGADSISTQADNLPEDVDGDGCELIIGVLVDALPPFDGATIPPLPHFQSIGSVDFTVKEDTECGSVCDIAFVDGLNGNGVVPVKNLISVENEALPPQTTDCPVAIVGEPVFYRGDCNGSGEPMGMAVNIADAAAAVSYLFGQGTWKFPVTCEDACDCNDDGRIDLADVICILQYVVQSDVFMTLPPAPGTGLVINDDGTVDEEGSPPGVDPTDDKLDCEGTECPEVAPQ